MKSVNFRRFAEGRMALSYREAANALSLSERSVWARVKSGEISAFRCGRSVRIPVSELEAFIARQVAANEQGGAA